MPYLFDEPCVIYMYRISDPYVALYCPSYDQIRKERERGREGGSRRDVAEEAKKEEQVYFPVGE